MSTTVSARPAVTAPSRTSPVLRVLGALLCLAVVYFHIKDQNGFPGEKADDSATWVQIGYYAVEAVGVVAAVLLLTRAVRTAWVLALGVALGPIIGYVLSRSTGLPSYGGDVGHWFGDPGSPFSEWLDTTSFVVEVVLALVALAALARLRTRR
jgi:di/tricarboxylate transporter